ncbi:MAG TPA: DNA polymerase [Mycobacteriales bacterium]|nr:DNA polymerase [Mycobacteriales bacterium]
MSHASEPIEAAAGDPLCLVAAPGLGLAVAWDGGSREVATTRPQDVVAELAAHRPRWTWWAAGTTAMPLVATGVRFEACWDLGAVGRLLHGLRRDDAAAVWAASSGLPEPPVPSSRIGSGEDALFAFDGSDLTSATDPESDEPLRDDGQLRADWAAGGWARSLATARRWAELGIVLQARQASQLHAIPDPRRALSDGGVRRTPLAVLNAHAESSTALLGVELEYVGLPLDREHATSMLRAVIGDRPADAADEAAIRQRRDGEVLREFPAADGVDLRSPLQVRALLARVGLDLPDTRSWRLAPHATASSGVRALLAWRKAERVATTYGWRWLDTCVGADGRLRGSWGAADGGAGRMTASAGLHNLPAELREAVRAEPGHLLVRADLGQIEPRVLAAVSADEAFTVAARESDLYAPVAERLQCDRPTAKIAVLAAMYGQTTGPAGEALKQMDLAYPRAMGYLRAAERIGQQGGELRTYGGRLIRFGGAAPAATERVTGDWVPDADAEAAPGSSADATRGRGRYARNAVIQGAAAELFKAWAATVRAGLPALSGQIVLCLHDELLLHVPEANVEAATDLLHASLAATAHWWAAGSEVRFVAEVSSGASWAAAHG